jgi:4-amino-4-deoxy-L-arabinose transferase-like glycosyltransferase
MPLYGIFGHSFLLLGRLSILLLSLICSFWISQWYERELKRNWIEAFFFLVTPLYFIKYSRIFMMEMPLTYLSVLGALYFYSYLNGSRKADLLLATTLAGLSVLIKGPVSLLMIFPGCFFFSLTKKREGFIKFFYFSLFSTLLGSLWFIASTVKYGQSFIDYFFIRENLGKFASKNYPARSVIQGLFIYSFPVNLLAIAIWSERKKIKLKSETIFLIINFVFFFFLWLLPKQKSHHYAVPSIPLMCLIFSYYFFSIRKNLRTKAFKVFDFLHHGLVLVCVFLGSLLFYFQEFLVFNDSNLYFSGALSCIGLWTFLRKKPLNKAYLLSFLIPFILLWQFILPLGFLPIVPSRVVEELRINPNSNLFVSHRKPFFIFEASEKEGLIVSSEVLNDPRIEQGDYVFLSERALSDQKDNAIGYKVVTEWNSWKRGVSLKTVLEALKAKDLKMVQTGYRLVLKTD